VETLAQSPRLKPSEAAPGCRVFSYAQNVLSGRIPAAKWIKAACKRHLDDLAGAHERGLWWDDDAARRAFAFIEGFLVHSKGKWNKQPFILSPWQAFIVGCLFGWKRADGTRRFRIAFVDLPRKNGKTTLAAAIALYLFLCDGEAGAEIYSVATKRDQAKLVFNDARAMVGRSPDLSEVVTRYVHSLEIPEWRSKFEAVGADANTLDGLNPFFIIADEIHAWKSRDPWDVMLTGMGARQQPLALAITTAGDFADSIYNVLRSDAEQVLEGTAAPTGDVDATFAFIATVDDPVKWTDPAEWAKANPNLGVSLDVKELSETIQRATRQPTEQNKVKRLRLGIRTTALDAWLRLDLWEAGSRPFDVAELDGKPCFGGLDLASTQDLASLVLAFPWGMERGEPVYRVLSWFWCPADADDYHAARLRRRILPWADAGLIELTTGNAIDHGRIEATVLDLAKRFDIRAIAYDPYNGEMLATRLTELGGLNLLRFPQNASQFNEPARALERAIAGGRLHHGGNPVLRWMASNAVAITNGAGHTMPARKKSRDKIDGVVALTMAVGANIRAGSDGGQSVYETRGFDE
jgi:phage terminase large subunit-like protein